MAILPAPATPQAFPFNDSLRGTWLHMRRDVFKMNMYMRTVCIESNFHKYRRNYSTAQYIVEWSHVHTQLLHMHGNYMCNDGQYFTQEPRTY